MKAIRILVPVAALVAMLVGTSLSSFATPAIAKKEAKECTVCHTQKGKKDLNDEGKKYKAAHPAPKK